MFHFYQNDVSGLHLHPVGVHLPNQQSSLLVFSSVTQDFKFYAHSITDGDAYFLMPVPSIHFFEIESTIYDTAGNNRVARSVLVVLDDEGNTDHVVAKDELFQVKFTSAELRLRSDGPELVTNPSEPSPIITRDYSWHRQTVLTSADWTDLFISFRFMTMALPMADIVDKDHSSPLYDPYQQYFACAEHRGIGRFDVSLQETGSGSSVKVSLR